MEITYQGEKSFLISASRTIAINPAVPQKSHINLFSARKSAERQIVSGPGEYEIAGAMIVALPASGLSQISHAIEVDGASLLFLAGEPSPLSENDLLSVGRVDVLIVDSQNIAAARSAAQDVGARVVLPYGERAAELCTALGVAEPQPAAKFTWNGHPKTPKAVLLKAPGARRRSKAA